MLGAHALRNISTRTKGGRVSFSSVARARTTRTGTGDVEECRRGTTRVCPPLGGQRHHHTQLTGSLGRTDGRTACARGRLNQRVSSARETGDTGIPFSSTTTTMTKRTKSFISGPETRVTRCGTHGNRGNTPSAFSVAHNDDDSPALLPFRFHVCPRALSCQ